MYSSYYAIIYVYCQFCCFVTKAANFLILRNAPLESQLLNIVTLQVS
jgi:hypothetical protein